MKKNYSKLVILNYVFLFLLELAFKLFVIKTADINIIYIMIFTFLGANVLSLISSLIPNSKVNKTIVIIFATILFFIFMAETIYYSFYKTICGVSGILYGGQVMEFYTAILSHVKLNMLIILLFFIIFIGYIILNFKVVKKVKIDYRIAVVLLVGSLSLILSILEVNNYKDDSLNNLITKSNDLMQTTNRIGVSNAIVIDTIKTAINFNEVIDVNLNYNFTRNENIEYNITDIDFDSLDKSDKTISLMDDYFESLEPTNKNKMTGIFAGKNLIFIVAEGFYPIAVDETLTPTLYKLVNSSFIFNNYYQPLFNCSTSDGEFINQLSILPGVKLCSMKATENVYLPYSLGNIMNKYGYKTYAYHGWTYSYYGRDRTMPNLGYEYYGFDRFKTGYKNALTNIKNQWPASDIEVVESSYPIYQDSSPFVAYYMSISGHLEYNFTGGNAMALKNKDLVKDMNASEIIKAYMATQIEFDRSLELLINKLKSDGILDDTVIVISPDHYPYGLSNNDIAEYVDWMKNPNFDLYKNNLVIYNSKIENTYVDKYTSSLDLLPTLLNMFGVKYDSRLLIGRDIFSESDDLVIFNNKSWITSKGRYDYMRKKFENFTDEEVNKDYIDEINKIVDNKFKMSKLLISKDYYRHLGGL